MIKNSLIVSLLISAWLSTAIYADPSADTAHYFSTIQNNPQQLYIFLHDMPKGGDLHSHITGAVYAEELIALGLQDNLCINPLTDAIYQQPGCKNPFQLKNIYANKSLYNKLIDAWSMRNFIAGTQSGHDHFFDSFGKFSAISQAESPATIALVAARAAEQNENYLELMIDPDTRAIFQLSKKNPWQNNFDTMRTLLFKNGLQPIIDDISHQTAVYDSSNAAFFQQHDITVRYLYQILRNNPPNIVFAQLLAGFAAANAQPLLVGINIVQPEDGYYSLRDYDLHMQMIAYLHQLYPQVHITLHAGELWMGLVKPSDLQDHINKAINIAHAERIGHGVDIAFEKNAPALLKQMAQNHIMVEINLVSNNEILNVKGNNHPLPLYLQNKVPVALSTDDEGILRTHLTEQYVFAVEEYHLGYPTLKQLVRNSLEYSFLPGKSLWQSATCAQNISTAPSADCQLYLNNNLKAKLQWQLEQRFNVFEQKYKS
jgi:adenosine deaminase